MKNYTNSTKTFKFQGIIWCNSFMIEQLSVLFITKSWSFTKKYSSKDHTLRVKSIKMYTDIIEKASIEVIILTLLLTLFLYWDEILEDTVQNNLKNLGRFQDKYLWWRSALVKLLQFTVTITVLDSENYGFTKHFDPMNFNLWFLHLF